MSAREKLRDRLAERALIAKLEDRIADEEVMTQACAALEGKSSGACTSWLPSGSDMAERFGGDD